jgi:hypothetical protein
MASTLKGIAKKVRKDVAASSSSSLGAVDNKKKKSKAAKSKSMKESSESSLSSSNTSSIPTKCQSSDEFVGATEARLLAFYNEELKTQVMYVNEQYAYAL